VQDENPDNPREFEPASTMLCFHRRYLLGDKTNEYWHGNSQDVVDHLKENASNYIVLPLYLLDHSGLWMRTRNFSDVDPGQWDSGQIGIIYYDRPTILKEWGWKYLTKKRKKLLKTYLEGEVELYNDYLTGNVWGYVIEAHGNVIDSCFGFYGDYQECLKEAKAQVDWEVEQAAKVAYGPF
jgi:hypothetical protein